MNPPSYAEPPVIAPPYLASRQEASVIAATAQAAARQAVESFVQQLPTTLENTTHGARRVRPPNKKESFMAAVKADPNYADLTASDREDLYERWKDTAHYERMLNTRGTLGIPQATIN